MKFKIYFTSLLLAAAAQGIDWQGLDIHGAVSATASYSDTYNYFGDTAEELDVNLLEATLNATYVFTNGIRAAAQGYAYQQGDYSQITLDFATLDYQFSEYLGVRLGRNKQPFGLYNM